MAQQTVCDKCRTPIDFPWLPYKALLDCESTIGTLKIPVELCMDCAKPLLAPSFLPQETP